MLERAEGTTHSRVLRFGVFQANLNARELRKHGVRVRLPGQPFCILSMLLERPGQIVTREEMRERLWASDTFVDFEHSLNSAVKKLRTALGDSPENSRYVETVPRLGYRFVAPVEVVKAPAPAPNTAVVADRSSVPPVSLRETGRPRWQIPVAISTLLIVVVGAYFGWTRVRQLQRTSIGEPRTPRVSISPSPEAKELYLRGLYYWNKRTVTGFQQAIVCFQQATKADPNYALAYAGLANSYTLLTAYSSASSTLYIPEARAAASRALELDKNSAEAHTALALIVQNHDWNWQTSEKEYLKAIELEPNYATAHHWYAEHLMWLGRFDEARRESERALQLDPLSLIIASDHGAILYYSRDYDHAIEQLQGVLKKDPNFNRARGILTFAYVEKGMFAQALTASEGWQRVYGNGPAYWMLRAYILGRAGKLEKAQQELRKLETLSRHEQVDPAMMIWAHLGVGDKEESLVDLEKACSEHANVMTTLKVDPAFDPLRSDARFQDLLQRVGLVDRIVGD